MSNYADALIKARRYEAMMESAEDEYFTEDGDGKFLMKLDGIKSKAKNKIISHGQKYSKKLLGDETTDDKGKKLFTNFEKNKKAISKYGAGDVMKAYRGGDDATARDASYNIGKAHLKNIGVKAGIGAGITAAGIGAAVAAKKIHDKKKRDEENNVQKENYEYSEYNELLETIIDNFMTDDEIMNEGADLAFAMADCMIEEADNIIRTSVSNTDKNISYKNGRTPANWDTVKYEAKKKADGLVADAKAKKNSALGWARAHKKGLAIGAGATAAGIGAAVAAKKIHDKKKRDEENDVQKENYEYPEYSSLVEAVINNFMSDDEIMSENAQEIAFCTADYLIDNIDRM